MSDISIIDISIENEILILSSNNHIIYTINTKNVEIEFFGQLIKSGNYIIQIVKGNKYILTPNISNLYNDNDKISNLLNKIFNNIK
jgi:hypothetical protein